MTYIKLFIDVTKKKTGNKNQNLDPKLEKRINEIFKEPLEDLFDKPELVRENFELFFNYSQDYYNTLINKGIKPESEQINEVINMIMQIDKNNETEYYKKLFLLEFLSCKIEGEEKLT